MKRTFLLNREMEKFQKRIKKLNLCQTVCGKVTAERHFAVFECRQIFLDRLRNAGIFDGLVLLFQNKYCYFLLKTLDLPEKSRFLGFQRMYQSYVSSQIDDGARVEEYDVPWVAIDKIISALPLKLEKSDIFAVVHSVAQAVFLSCQEKLLHIQQEKAGSSMTASTRSSAEDKTSLLMMGGGTMCEMVKTWKKVFKMSKNNEKKRQKSLSLLRLVSAFKMDYAEKKALGDPFILSKDRGWMYIPGIEFLDFLSEVSGSVTSVAKADGFSFYGEQVVKASMEGVKRNDVLLYDLFESAAAKKLKKMTKILEPGLLRIFYDVWKRKLCHCRLGHFVRFMFDEECDRLETDKQKGGANLRDKLYNVSSKVRKK